MGIARLTNLYYLFCMEHPRFAGQKPIYPKRGAKVIVLEGEYKGQVVEVVEMAGHAFADFYRVIVRAPDGGLVWYWPWNLSREA